MFWHDGTLSAGSTLPFDFADRGFLLGDGVFDTSLVLGGTMVWREAHFLRLDQACGALGFTLDHQMRDEAVAALTEAVPNGVLRLTATRGAARRGLAPPARSTPVLMAALMPAQSNPAFAPLSLAVTTIRRNETSPTSRLKTLNYLDAVMAAGEAVASGFDDALFLNTRGHVACVTIGNIVALQGSRLVTPPISDGVMPGIVRAALLRLAPSVGLEPLERSLTLNDLFGADAVLVTNSLKLMAPVTRIGAVPKPPSKGADALADALCADIQRDCGIDPRLAWR